MKVLVHVPHFANLLHRVYLKKAKKRTSANEWNDGWSACLLLDRFDTNGQECAKLILFDNLCLPCRQIRQAFGMIHFY